MGRSRTGEEKDWVRAHRWVWSACVCVVVEVCVYMIPYGVVPVDVHILRWNYSYQVDAAMCQS